MSSTVSPDGAVAPAAHTLAHLLDQYLAVDGGAHLAGVDHDPGLGGRVRRRSSSARRPTRTTTSPASRRIGSSPSGQTHEVPAHDGGHRQRRLVRESHRPRCVEQDAQQEGAAALGTVEQSGSASITYTVDARAWIGTAHSHGWSLTKAVHWRHDLHSSAQSLSTRAFVTTALAGPARGPLLVVATVVAGLQAGTYFTWATGVMPGLARVDDRTFVHADAADERRHREPALHRDLPRGPAPRRRRGGAGRLRTPGPGRSPPPP